MPLSARRAIADTDHAPTGPRRRSRAAVFFAALCLAFVLSTVGLVATAPAASAATQGTGFGTWAPLSTHGWHGSMLVNGMHTYCILPGLPAPTGESIDHGVRTDAGGLGPQQLVAINRIIAAYGQTDDPVQAAAVGWAVKAIADRESTLHAWGYTGDSLAGAVHWSFDRFAPESAAAVAARAEQYHAEALATPVPGSDGSVTLSTDPTDPRRGSVRINGGAGTTATISLTNAVFADSGAAELAEAPRSEDIAIIAVPPASDGAPFSVHAAARFRANVAPAVRFITTAGQQNTAGPGGAVDYAVQATDASPRPVIFSPSISTQVAAPEVPGGPYVDDVTIAPVEGVWPRALDGTFVALRATAVVYRTEETPAPSDVPPSDASIVGELTLTTDPTSGGGTYRVTSEWLLPGPGHYTAVWSIAASAQDAAVAAHLERDFVWSEQFATPTQITVVRPEPAPASIEPTAPALADTGPHPGLPRVAGWATVALILGGSLLAHHAQQRRRIAVP